MVVANQVDVTEAADGFKYAETWAGKMEQVVNGLVDHDDIEPMLRECANIAHRAGPTTLRSDSLPDVPAMSLEPRWNEVIPVACDDALAGGGIFEGSSVALLVFVGRLADAVLAKEQKIGNV